MAELRKAEIKDWLKAKLAASVLEKSDHYRKVQLIETDNEIFKDAQLTQRLKMQLGMIESDRDER